eukprot:14984870-Heterocapsa_arctica.AAC.1
MPAALGTDLHNARRDAWIVGSRKVKAWINPLDCAFVFETLGSESTSVIIELATFKCALAHNAANVLGNPSL